jgi:TonB family protein
MLLHEEEKNILTGILGTVVVHLLVVIVILITRIDKVKNIHHETIVIEFDEELFKTLEQLQEEKMLTESKVDPLTQQDIKNIAVNAARQLDEKISTEKYIEQLKEELNISDLNQQLDNTIDNDAIIQEPNKELNKDTPENEYRGPTRIEYDLGGRGARYIHYPIYKCQGSGKVVVDIVVNPVGEVISASVASSNTHEVCISETALESARKSLFEMDLSGKPKERGTISYEFVAQ